jgi:hypothetical protein
MAVTPLPSLNRTDADFKSKTDTFFGTELPTFTNQINTEIARINEIGSGTYTGTTTSSLLIATGSNTLTTQTGKSFGAGQFILIARTSVPSTYMIAQVTSYNSATGVLVSNVSSVTSSGTFSDWTISITPPNAAEVPIGTISSATKTKPAGTWLKCDSSIYLQSSYSSLFSEIGILPNSPNSVGVLITRTAPASTRWTSVAYGNGIYAAVGYGAVVASSSNSTVWTSRTIPTANWTSVAYGNGVFVAVSSGSDIAATSPDGITWTQRTMPLSSNWLSITYANALFVAVSSTSGTIAATSPDGITWTQRTLPSSSNWRSITYGNALFVVVSNGTAAATSSDGITWTQRTLPASANWLSITYGNGLFITVTDGSVNAFAGTILTSLDGITWTQRTLPFTGVSPSSITYGDGLFVVVASQNSIAATSPDGLNWTQRTLPSADQWTAVGYGNGIFCVVSTSSASSSNVFVSSQSMLTYNRATQFVTPPSSGQLGVVQFIKAL